MSDTQIATKASTPMELFRGDMKRMEAEFAMVLPSQIPVDRFIRTTITAVAMNPALLNADKQSLLSATMKAAQDGLLCDNREAALVIFGDKIQYLPMIGGLLKKMRNSGQVSNVSASVVYEKDKFAYIKGDNERIEHDPYLDGDRGALRLAYAIAWLKDGSVQREVMTRQDIEKVRGVSKAKNGPAWTSWESEMWRKSVLRRLHKYLPSNAEIEQLIKHDNETYDHDMHDITPEPISKTEAIKEKLRRGKKAIEKPADIVPEPEPMKEAEVVKSEWEIWGDGFKTALKACTNLDELDALKSRHQKKIIELADTNKPAFAAIEKLIIKAAKELAPVEE